MNNSLQHLQFKVKWICQHGISLREFILVSHDGTHHELFISQKARHAHLFSIFTWEHHLINDFILWVEAHEKCRFHSLLMVEMCVLEDFNMIFSLLSCLSTYKFYVILHISFSWGFICCGLWCQIFFRNNYFKNFNKLNKKIK